MSTTRVSSRKTSVPCTPLPIAPPTPNSPRRHRARHMHLHEPMESGLFTVSEADEDEFGSFAGPSSRHRSSWQSDLFYPSSPAMLSSDTHDSREVTTPCSENDDPFSLDGIHNGQFDSAEDHGHLQLGKSLFTSRSPFREGRRPPPLDLDSFLGHARSPAGRSPRTATTPSTARPIRVSSGLASPLPRTPTMGTSGLLPALPILSDEQWEAARDSMPSPITPTTPLTPRTPSDPSSGVNLVSALRELLTTCGEYDDQFCKETGMFADAPESPVKDADRFADAPSPCQSPRRKDLYTTPEMSPSYRAVPGAPYAKVSRANRPAPRFTGGNHTFLQSLSASATPNVSASNSMRSMTSVPGLSPSSSMSSLRSSDSVQSISSSSSSLSGSPASFISTSSIDTSPSPSRTGKAPRVSSRRNLPMRASLPAIWTDL
ncbi:uncharacterized protein LOC62_06G008546 [Vanrija pseudolonga]|uniref:Uncharacterized protein n=1 Tax=Vanrija pseudolonga TaxID=143232 RepID=A0AAF0YES8_9TREE|nr:hypothetical protein LOC62_06G008546 [Vanrija pseudolonga]